MFQWNNCKLVEHIAKSDVFRIETQNVSLIGNNKQDFILDNISAEFDFTKNRCVGIHGPSGSGKTTFAKVLAGIIKADSGRVLFNNINISQIPRLTLKKTIQLVFQDSVGHLYPNWKIQDILLEGAIIHRGYERKSEFLNELQILVDTMFPDRSILEKYPRMLSAGESKRVSIIRSLMVKPKILILDEPTAGVDVVNKRILGFVLSMVLKAYIKGIITISHDMEFLKIYCDKLIEFDHGRIIRIINIS